MIYPSELVSPYELDTSNPLAAQLLAANTGVFISDDNLATVINVLNGTAGTSTDITTNERSEAIGGYRIGYDYSALSVEAQSQIDADPYQVFKTREDEITQSGLLGILQGQTIFFNMSGAYELTLHFKDGTTQLLTGTNTHKYDCRYDPYILYADGYDADGNLFYDCNQVDTLGYIPELIQGKHGGYGFNMFEGVVSPLAPQPADFGVYFDQYYYGTGGGQFNHNATDGTVFELDVRPDKLNGNAFLGRNSNYGYLIFEGGGIQVRRSAGNEATVATDIYTVGERLTLSIVFGVGQFSIYKNGTFVETVASEIRNEFTGLGSRTTTLKGHLYSFKIYEGGYGGTLVRDYDFSNAYGFRVPDRISPNIFSLNTALPGPVIRQPLFDEPQGFRFEGGNTRAAFETPIALHTALAFSVKFVVYLTRGWNSIQLSGGNNEALHISPTHWYAKFEYAGSKVKKTHGTTLPENQRVTIEITRDNAGLTQLIVDDVVVDSDTWAALGDTPLNEIGACSFDGENHASNCFVIYESIEIVGNGIHHYYDMVTGDNGRITDTISGNHAQVINPTGFGFFPITPDRIFTTNQDGVGADFALNTSNIQVMVSNANSADERMVIHITEDVVSDDFIRIGYLGDATHQPIVDGLIPFNGDLKDTVNNRTVLFTSGSWFDYQPIIFRNMLTDSSSLTLGAGGLLENVGLDNTGVNIRGKLENPSVIKNSVVSGLGSTAKADEASREYVTFIDSILTSRAIIRQFNTVKFINSISTANDFSLDYSNNEIIIQNSRIADQLTAAMSDEGGNQFGTDFTGAFVDSANDNYQINQAWADINLVGQGTNNTDIAGWAYSDGEVPSEVTVTVAIIESQTALTATPINVNQSLELTPVLSETFFYNESVSVSSLQNINITASETSLTYQALSVGVAQFLPVVNSETALTADTFSVSVSQSPSIVASSTSLTYTPPSTFQTLDPQSVTSESRLESVVMSIGQDQVIVSITSETDLEYQTLSVSQVQALEAVVSETLLEVGAITVNQSVHLFTVDSQTELTAETGVIFEPGQVVVVASNTPLWSETGVVSQSQHVSLLESETAITSEVTQISRSVAVVSINSELVHSVAPISLSQSLALASLESETALQSQVFEIASVITLDAVVSETALMSEIIEIVAENLDTDPDTIKPISASTWFRLVDTTKTFKLTMR